MIRFTGALQIVALLLALQLGAAADEAGRTGDAWTSSIGLGVTTTSGNSDVTNVAVTFQALNDRAKTRWSTSANVAYTTTDGAETANRGGVSTRYEVFPMDRFFYFGKIGIEYDRFTNLDLRTSPGGGVGYILVQEGKRSLSVSAGVNAVTDFFNDDTRDSRGTLSFRQELALPLSAVASLSQNFNIQNNFDDFEDFLLDAELSLSSKVSERLSLKASLLDKYDNRPFSDDVRKNDVTFITSLNYTL
jgi:putative salt-induced outer membrane protein YdiY